MSFRFYRLAFSLGLPTLLLGLLGFVLSNRQIPLGLLGEWVWNRAPDVSHPQGEWMVLAAILGYAATAGLGGYRFCLGEKNGSTIKFAERFGWLAGLLAVTMILQMTWFELPAPSAGLERWPIALYHPATSGYYLYGRRINNPQDFLKNYPAWIIRQDSFHIGTHPPALFLESYFVRQQLEKSPPTTQWLLGSYSSRFSSGYQILASFGAGQADNVDRSALGVLAWMAWICQLATALGLYLIGSTFGRPSTGWWMATIWGVTPASIVFLPISDSLFPLITTIAVGLTMWAGSKGSIAASFLVGVVLWFGMMHSLCFIPVGFLCTLFALGISFSRRKLWSGQVALCLVGGLGGFVLPTFLLRQQYGVWMPDVWMVNIQKHAGFYQAMPRSYFPWLLLNLADFGAVIGPVGVLASIAGCWRQKEGPKTFWWVAVALLSTVFLLDIAGRNRSEAGRLWLFLAPITLIPMGTFGRENCKESLPIWHWLAWILLQAGATTLLVRHVEPLLPVAITS